MIKPALTPLDRPLSKLIKLVSTPFAWCNTNSQYYGGTGSGNGGGADTDDIPANGFGQSVNLALPSMSTTIFKWAAKA